MPLTATDLRKWIARFEAADAADRATHDPSALGPARSFALALPLIDAACRAFAADPRLRAVRERDDERSRQIWRRLRTARTR